MTGQLDTGAEMHARRAACFGSVAPTYEANRPGYPPEAAAWLVGADPALRVVDVGAGTGKLSRVLAALGHRVTAVDPSARMLDHVGAGLRTLMAGAEHLPLPDDCADAVTVAQAFHWFDAPRALAEFARVLRPGGRLAVVYNQADEEAAPWTERLPVSRGKGPTVNSPAAAITESGLYGPVEVASFPHVQVLDRAGLVGLASSQSPIALLDPSQREEALEAVSGLFDAHAGGGRVELPWQAVCWRTRSVSRPG